MGEETWEHFYPIFVFLATAYKEVISYIMNDKLYTTRFSNLIPGKGMKWKEITEIPFLTTYDRAN